MGKEQEIMNSIIAYLKKKGFRVGRMNSGMVRTAMGRYVRLLPRGFSDIMAIDTYGLCHFIEVKTPLGRPTNEQLEFLKDMRSIGCKAGIATTLEEVEDILKGGVGNAKKFNMQFKKQYIDWEQL